MTDYISKEDALGSICIDCSAQRDCRPGERCVDYMRIKAIPAADVLESPRWISVKERLPEEQQDVLVYLKRGGCAVDYFIPSRNDKWGYKDVTHWMPLPTPPKEDEA